MGRSGIVIPSRSSLYPLKPKGLGTPFTESLTSYINRLAKAYCVSPKALVLQEILPFLSLSPAYTDKIHARWSEGGQNLNGLTPSTAKWTNVLKQLTSRGDLHLLTMITWSAVLSQSGMFRCTRAWCSACYNEWYACQEVYEPLLWAFQDVTVCPRHRQTLSLRCPRRECQKFLPALSRKSLPGYCPWCGSWLGAASVLQTPQGGQELDEQAFWTANAIGELIASAMNLKNPPQKEVLSSAIRSQMTKINVSTEASQMHVCRELMYSWAGGVRKPKLSTLLQVSLGLHISPLELLTRNIVSIPGDNQIENSEQDIRGGRRKTPSSPVEVLSSLEAVLLSSEKPTVKAVAKDLGYSNTCTIYELSPDLCHAIAAKRRTDTLSVKKMLEDVMAGDENPPPPMREVARRLGYSVQVLNRRFPEMCRAISERYAAYQRRKRDKLVRLKCEEVRSIAIRLYEQGEYPSQRKVRNLLRNPHDFLRKEVYTAWRETLQRLGIFRPRQ